MTTLIVPHCVLQTKDLHDLKDFAVNKRNKENLKSNLMKQK